MNLKEAITKNRQEVKDMQSPILELYAIRDLKSDFAPPVALTNKEVAKRWFGRLVKNDATISYAPGDFDLYFVGFYNTKTAEITIRTPELIFNGKELE